MSLYMRFIFIISVVFNVLSTSVAVCAEQTSGYSIETLAEGLDRPYAFAFLPDGDILITEKSNRLRIVRNDALLSFTIAGVPDVFVDDLYCGLLDIVLHPRFEDNNFIYFSYTYGRKDANATRVSRAQYINEKLQNVEEIFTAFPMKDTLNHAGGHMAFLSDETLLITVGEGFEYREKAQDLESMLGKIVRVTDTGEIPENNPFTNKKGHRTPVWSYGHRHPQGLLYDAVAETVYEHEHGPQGGDEINIIKPGNNYGWPIATQGMDYSGVYVSPFKEYPGTEPPLVNWTPSLAPSGITQCRNCQWKEWEGDLFVGMLKTKHVRRIHLEKGVVREQEALFEEIGERIRNLGFGPDGALYVLTENKAGRLLKIVKN